MELARRVQMQLLPEPASFERLNIHTLFKPAEALSGDFYQFFSNPGMEGFVIGDASGHGISASLIMALATAAFRNALLAYSTGFPGILLSVNSKLKDVLGDDFFVTALIFGVDPGTLQATYASAGHAGPILIKPDGKLRHLTVSGIPLGMFDNPLQYDIHRAKLKGGDRLLFFTDGATESRNTTREMYGIKRLQACIKRNAHLSGDALLRSIADDTSAFLVNSDRADDMTLVLVEVV
jgi:serine phosphatase RsbU (regulator of sigma subunit)